MPANASFAPNLVEFATEDPLPLDVDGRFLTFSVDAATNSCTSNHPKLRFFLEDQGLERAVSPTAIDPCVGGTDAGNGIVVGTFSGAGALLFTGEELGIVLRNEQGLALGNDHAFDNIRVLDATPQLDKAFAGPATVDQPSAVTFTVTNTSELGAKPGWSFTDTLPTGLKVASPSGVTTTCPNTTVTASGGSGSISVLGDLGAGQTSCTVSVNVAASRTGTYTNGPDNIAATGLDLPGSASLTVGLPATAGICSAKSVQLLGQPVNPSNPPAVPCMSDSR